MASVRFIPGPDQGVAEIVVLGVELHEDLIVIDIVTTMLSAIRNPTRRNRLPSVRVEDDLGNTYSGVSLERYGFGWSGNAPAAHYAFEVAPQPAPDARFLRITFGSMYADNRTVVVAL
jgi:hypothetical protein